MLRNVYSMEIAVDAGCLSGQPRVLNGTARITLELFRRMGSLDRSIRYRLYSFRPIAREHLSAFGPTVENTVVHPSFGYMRLRIPFELLRKPADVFLGMSQVIPHTMLPSVVFVYDTGFLKHPEMYGVASRRLASDTAYSVERARRILTLTEATKSDLIQTYGTEPTRIIVAQPGISSCFTPDGKKSHIRDPYFLTVGTRQIKNVPWLIGSFAAFHRRDRSGHRLVIVGHENTAALRELVTSENLKDFVDIVPPVTDQELAGLYRGATATLTASLWEGFGLPVAESMSCGTPLIAFRISSIPEVTGPAGLLTECGDRDAYVNALHQVATDDDLKRTLSRHASEQARQFSWERFAAAVLQELKSV